VLWEGQNWIKSGFICFQENATKNKNKGIDEQESRESIDQFGDLDEQESRESIDQFGDLLSSCCFALSVSLLFFLLQLFHSLSLQTLVLTDRNNDSQQRSNAREK
jgi:hypothetical protein